VDLTPDITIPVTGVDRGIATRFDLEYTPLVDSRGMPGNFEDERRGQRVRLSCLTFRDRGSKGGAPRGQPINDRHNRPWAVTVSLTGGGFCRGCHMSEAFLLVSLW